MSNKILSATDLVRVYDNGKVRTVAVNGVSFDLYEGEFVALSGPSGSGKSTILYQLGLLDIPTKGKIIIDGKDTSKLHDEARAKFRLDKIGYVFQSYELLPELTAFENVCLPLMIDYDYKDYESRVVNVLGLLDLKERMHHFPNEMSGGEQQRVAIARAIVKNPKIIFADEPTANLDSEQGHKIMRILKKLNKDLKKTIFVVNHEKDFEKYFDRIIRIKDGKIVSIEETNRKE